MNTQELAFLRECLDWHKKPYFYFKDKYALDLLALYVGAGVKIGVVKQSEWGFLLDKPPLKQITASLPGKLLTAEILSGYWPGEVFAFTLSLDKWGTAGKHRHETWDQTSRPGLNLVLQLNFGQDHNVRYQQLIRPGEEDHPFITYCHPVNQDKDFTLAWARLDVDLDTGEVLVEEIQNDWLRYADEVYHRVTGLFRESKEQVKNHWFFRETKSSYGRFRQYYENVLQPHAAIWDEAMLAAVIQFVRHELGISRIYYHTFESGNRMKHIRKKRPPKSLYTRLPRRFGFRETGTAPRLIQNTRYLKKKLAAMAELSWFVLDLGQPVDRH
jgi:hypothetical protein